MRFLEEFSYMLERRLKGKEESQEWKQGEKMVEKEKGGRSRWGLKIFSSAGRIYLESKT